MEYSLSELTSGELAAEMWNKTKRYGELSLWITECEVKIHTIIAENLKTQEDSKVLANRIAGQLKLKHDAEAELYVILSNLKNVELEIDKRIEGITINE